MASIGPQIPAHGGKAARQVSGSAAAAEQPGAATTAAGPSTIGPMIPAQMPPPTLPLPRYEEEEEDEEDEDAYVPELPPELAAARMNPSGASALPAPAAPASVLAAPRRMMGPARVPLRREEEEEESSEDEEIGPVPLGAAGSSLDAREDAVTEFMQKEAQRRLAVEEASRPKTLQRQEWMLVPPSSSDLLKTLDPTKLNKPRQFSRSTAPAKVVDNTLWTETPAERQQRLADEVMGRKRRVENPDPDQDLDTHAKDDASKRRKRDAELRQQVDEYTRTHRGPSLIKAHEQEEAKRKEGASEEPAAIWDHARDMAMGGRLMEEKDRRRIIQDAKGLSDRFGASKGGSFL